MAALDGLRNPLANLRGAMVQTGLQVADIPQEGQPSRLYAYWFALLVFLLQTSQQRDQPVPMSLRNAVERFSEQFSKLLGIQLPPLPPYLSFLGLGSYFGVAAAAAGGDCWCRHDDGIVAMELYRNYTVAPEFDMTCTSGHVTEYDVHGANRHIRKM